MKREGEQYFILAERQKKKIEGRSNKRGREREKEKAFIQ